MSFTAIEQSMWVLYAERFIQTRKEVNTLHRSINALIIYIIYYETLIEDKRFLTVF